MKSIKQLREQFDLITEKDENEERKLTTLVRSGLVDTNKLSVIKRALNKDNKVLTPAERNALMSLLDSLMAQVLSHNSVYNKVKQNVMKEELRPVTTRMSDMPSILVLKRKAIRVYPGGQNVGLYYSQQLDRYVAVPFAGRDTADTKGILNMMEESELNEISDALRYKTYAGRVAKARNSVDPDEQIDHVRKAMKTAVQTVARGSAKGGIKKGIGDWRVMQAHADAEYEKNYGKKPNSQSPKKKSGKMKFRMTKGQKWNELDKKARGTGTFGGDLVNNLSSGRPTPIAHAIGAMIYRKMNPTTPKMPKGVKLEEQLEHMTEEQLQEYLNFVAQGALALARSGIGRAAIGGAMKLGRRALVAGKNLGKKIKRTGKRAAIRAARNARNNSGGGSQTADQAGDNSPSIKGVGYGGPSQERLKPRRSFDDDRARRANRAMADQGVQQYQQVKEQIDLDGNLFEINSSVAQKVVSVYQSLNEQNRQKMVEKMNESAESLNKVISFAIRH